MGSNIDIRHYDPGLSFASPPASTIGGNVQCPCLTPPRRVCEADSLQQSAIVQSADVTLRLPCCPEYDLGFRHRSRYFPPPASPMKQCAYCGRPTKESAHRCRSCGNSTFHIKYAPSDAQKFLAEAAALPAKEMAASSRRWMIIRVVFSVLSIGFLWTQAGGYTAGLIASALWIPFVQGVEFRDYIIQRFGFKQVVANRYLVGGWLSLGAGLIVVAVTVTLFQMVDYDWIMMDARGFWLNATCMLFTIGSFLAIIGFLWVWRQEAQMTAFCFLGQSIRVLIARAICLQKSCR